MKRQPFAYWAFAAVCILHAAGFIINYFREDVTEMVWYGFTGLIWYKLADRERVDA